MDYNYREGPTLYRRSLHNQSLEESAKLLMRRGKYAEALSLLEAVTPITVRQQLLLAECYLQTGHETDAKRSITRLNRMMTSPYRPKIDDVTRLIKKSIASSLHVKALILLQCAPKIAFFKLFPDEAVLYIDRRVTEYRNVVRRMLRIGGRVGEIAVWFVRNAMLDIMVLFREIVGANFARKIDCESRILTYFGLCYRDVGDHLKSLECFQQGLELLNLNFNQTFSTSKVFGTLLHNAGLEHETLGEFGKAEIHYTRALEVLENANDWEGHLKRENSLKIAVLNLKELHEKMEGLRQNGNAKSVKIPRIELSTLDAVDDL